jgi:cholesterol transport system auxiliary component
MTLKRRHLLLATPLTLAGCGGILAKQPYIARNDWPLAPPPPPNQATATPRGIVQVQSIQAGPTLSQRGLITLLAAGTIHQGYYNRWATEPAQATTAALIAWLQASGAFAAVVGEGTSLTPTLIVEGTLDTLLADPAHNIARASLTLVVARPVGISEQPLAQHQLTATAPLTNPTAPALVTAQRTALASILSQAVSMVRAAGGV